MSVRRAAISFLLTLIAVSSVAAQTPDAGRQVFVARCAGCHGTDGNGGELGPGIAARIPLRTDEDLTTLLEQGLPGAGMPSFSTLPIRNRPISSAFCARCGRATGSGPARAKVTLDGGRTLEGLVMNQSAGDMQLLGDDRRIHLLRKTGNTYRPRHVADRLDELQRRDRRQPLQPAHADRQGNVATLAPKWIFSLPNTAPAAGHAGRRRAA